MPVWREDIRYLRTVEDARRIKRLSRQAREILQGCVAENVAHLFGLDVAAVGITKVRGTDKASEEMRLVSAEKKLNRKLVVQGNWPIGAILFGDLRDIGVVRNVIAHSVDVSHFKSCMATMPLNSAGDILAHSLNRCSAKE